jgi:hypothetical protein
VSNENGLATPFDDDVLAEGDCRKVNFDFSLGEHIGGRSHVDEEIWECDVSGVPATWLFLDHSRRLSTAQDLGGIYAGRKTLP